MVQLMMKSGGKEVETAPYDKKDKVPVKVEVEDALEDQYAPFSKRSKPFQGSPQWSGGGNAFPVQPSEYNPLDEPSPLGLRLRKSPSLLELIQMKLSQGSSSGATEICNSGYKKNSKATTSQSDKLKASNFPASLLRIGTWEYASKYEGDLVAKCYFAKHKLVWEVLEGGLKSKIEIQWSDIMGLKADCPETGSATLKVVLARQPLFFRETNPQPRKHTLWQATADFTDGQASINRLHFLQCPLGMLNKHFEKLIQCDMRLNFLSQQPDIVLDSPYFEPRTSIFEELDEPRSHNFDQLEIRKTSASSSLSDTVSLSVLPSSTMKIEQRDLGRVPDHLSGDASSPSSVMDTQVIEGHGNHEADELKCTSTIYRSQLHVPGLPLSMPMNDLMSHIGQCLSEQMTSVDPASGEAEECRGVLEDITQYLLGDNQLNSASDEAMLMTRVNSLCRLLQKEPSVQNLQSLQASVHHLQADGAHLNDGKHVQNDHEGRENRTAPDHESKETTDSKQAPGMSRIDSYTELLFQLPRIASLPKFLFNISEDGESHGR